MKGRGEGSHFAKPEKYRRGPTATVPAARAKRARRSAGKFENGAIMTGL